MKLSEAFLEDYKTAPVNWGPVGEITYRRTYSRDGEEWWQTCRRVAEGCYAWQRKHCTEVGQPWSDSKAQHSMQEMYKLIFDMKFLPPGRGLFTMGTGILERKGGAAANNCGFVSTAGDGPDAYCWAMDMLMLGVGVGFDTKGHGNWLHKPRYVKHTFYVKDSREGWVGALRHLLSSHMCQGFEQFRFDYSAVRAKGEPVGFGGTASGPEPLIDLLDTLDWRLHDCREKHGMLTSEAIVDIMNMIGRCIVSGNIRRSAEIAIGDPEDGVFLQLKNKKKHPEENDLYRWAANHSVACKTGTDYDKLVSATSGIDELGIFWIDNARSYARMGRRPTNTDHRVDGCNPCAEQSLEHKELCCLVEVFPSRHDSYYELQRTLKYAYLYAKTVTLIPVHDHETNEIVKRNRRIGASLTGIQQAIVKHGQHSFYDWCSRGYKYLQQLDDRYSTWFHVPRSIKLTSVKPSGTVSKLPGVSAGIHFPPSEYYYQVIRFASDSPYLRPMRDAGYRCVDLSPGEPNTTAVYFGVKEPHFSRAESDVSMWEQALHAVKMQHLWADNQVSITVKYRKEERSQIPALLRMVEHDLKAISFTPYSLSTHEHAPWQPISEKEYLEYQSRLRPLQLSSVHEKEDSFCDGAACEVARK